MRILHVILSRASAYERKSQRIDFEALHGHHEVVVAESVGRVRADVTQIYGPPSSVGSTAVSPLINLPEAVGEEFWPSESGGFRPLSNGPRRKIGSFLRPSILPVIEGTLPRLHRTRDDIEWLLLDRIPSPDDFAQFDLWVDPAVGDEDFDGFVAEALVRGQAVVASRTPINIRRLEKGRTGILTPQNDPNELTHAILAALFKTELAQQKIEAARQTISKFHPRQRLRALTQLLATARQ